MIVRILRILLLVAAGALWTATNEADAEGPFLESAVPLAQTSQRETTVPASITLAQAVWETGRGAHPIGEANNYFGIKAAGTRDETVNVGPIATGWVWAWTKEWSGTRYEERRERFRKYASMEDSFRDHGLLLATTPRYAYAMLAVDDPREFARRIADAGYATSPTYARDLIEVMDRENLYRFDLPRNALEQISQAGSTQARAGDIFQIYFEVKNIGFGTWSPAAGYHLASEDGELFGAKARQELDQVVQPGRVKRWAITMVAPQEAGTYSTTWQVMHGEQAIGKPMSVEIRVTAVEAGLNPWLWRGAALAALAGGGVIWNRYSKKKRSRAQYR